MGIRQLNKIIKKVAPTAITERSIHELIHSKIAIDSAILMYKYRYASQGSDDSHIHGFVQRVCFYLKRGVLPIFVFDGIPPEAKKMTLDKRIRQKSKVEEKINQLIISRGVCTTTNLLIDEEINKLSKQVTYVTKSHRQECKYLLKLLGVPVIEANGEAENTCASLQKKGIVDYTYTEDTDALTFGAPYVLKSARKMEKVIQMDLQEILDKTNLSMSSFIDFCILCGCDYCPTIPKIGPVTAFNLITNFENIETILENLDPKYNIPTDFDYVTARKLFNHDPIKDLDFSLEIKETQTDKLKDFLTKEKNLSVQVYNNIVKKYSKALLDYKKINKKVKKQEPNILNFFKKFETKEQSVSQSVSESESKNMGPEPSVSPGPEPSVSSSG
jgi:flap endonuclease-1